MFSWGSQTVCRQLGANGPAGEGEAQAHPSGLQVKTELPSPCAWGFFWIVLLLKTGRGFCVWASKERRQEGWKSRRGEAVRALGSRRGSGIRLWPRGMPCANCVSLRRSLHPLSPTALVSQQICLGRLWFSTDRPVSRDTL